MIKAFQNIMPTIKENVWVAESAEVIGDVILHEQVSVWYKSVIRGDSGQIVIEAKTNIQDGCILHTDPGHELRIQQRVSVGHGCILHGCTIEDDCLIGMGAIIMNGAHIGAHSIIGAGAVVTEMSEIPARSLVVGCPAKVIRTISEDQMQDIQNNATHYLHLMEEHKKGDVFHG
ncbi:MAG: gamma carbonic anhydrase family protein [Erysipelotrichaceae bacterium]|jgi:carbonic anhydrase/acetyltransferase-like protein (isoleucine patch superfamily)|nr:gamma carbonic anhydrase family protein [Erysipelotrichaceae bacterium]MCI9523887.1 gamma carbonic anhydrase family protein [Erysipelotrichaceae bacterium]